MLTPFLVLLPKRQMHYSLLQRGKPKNHQSAKKQKLGQAGTDYKLQEREKQESRLESNVKKQQTAWQWTGEKGLVYVMRY